VAKELDRSPAEVALNWITKRPGVTSSIIGATKMTQLESNLTALEFDIPDALSARLDEAGRPDVVFPYNFYEPAMRDFSMGGVKLAKEPPWFRG
jgi:diketogulonate reductase-like aldo/keto reductase